MNHGEKLMYKTAVRDRGKPKNLNESDWSAREFVERSTEFDYQTSERFDGLIREQSPKDLGSAPDRKRSCFYIISLIFSLLK